MQAQLISDWEDRIKLLEYLLIFDLAKFHDDWTMNMCMETISSIDRP